MIKFLLRFFFGKYYFRILPFYWNIIAMLYPIFYKKKGVLIYAGVNTGESFRKIFFKYRKVYGFEPNPLNFSKVEYFNRYGGVEIYNYALSDFDGEVKLYLPNNQNNHASASLSDFNTNFYIKAESIISVKAKNLNDFLKSRNVKYIDFYFSDIEGYDFTVLKTLYEEYILKSKIAKIQIEALPNSDINPYKSVSNFESDFDDLLLNYQKVGRGNGIVKFGDDFNGSPVDLLYILKTR